MEIKYNKEALYRQAIHIYTEANPNPSSMKFMLNVMLLNEGSSIDFPDAESAQNSPLAQELFQYAYMKRVFYMSNFITITKDSSVEWEEVIAELKAHIRDFFDQKKPLFTEDQKTVLVEANNDSEAVKKIKGILDEYIRPAVEMDGGAIQFESFDEGNGVLKVMLQGACSGCPSSTITLKAGIENLVKRMVPTVKEVVATAG